MNITITLSEEDQLLQAEILKVLLKAPLSDKSDKSDKTPMATEEPTEQPAPKPYPLPTEPAPSDTSDTSDTSDKAATPSDPSDKPAPAPEAPALSMDDLRKSVNAISRKKGLNWLYSWLGDLGVKSIAEIPTDRLEEANTKLQNYA